jgi:two-component sensor histidine kinase
MKGFFSTFMILSRRDRFIYGITAAVAIIALFGAILDILSGRDMQAIVQSVISGLAVLLLVHYHYIKSYTFFVYSGITIATIGYNALLYFDHFVLHSYLILMIIPLIIFFLLPLRQAWITSVIYYLVLAGFSYYGYRVLHIESAMFEKNALQVYTFGALFILAFGTFYQLAIEASYRKMEHANIQKELLLKEIHHRIKNNLNKMSSGLGLQILRLHRGHVDEPEEILRKNKLRIETMALLHEALYRSDDIANVEVGAYIQELITLIERAYGRSNTVTMYVESISLSLEKILRLGTVLNELYTNSIKHTQADKVVHIDINFTQTNGSCELIYRQSGHMDQIDPKKLQESHGLGMMLVRLSVEEMDGDLAIESTQNDLRFTITFSC